MAWFGDFIDWYHDNGLIPGLWKGITGQQSQEKMAEENLQYQVDRNAIEDARYAEETAYNRAFAEDERNYNRTFAEGERAYNRAFAEEERNYQRQWALDDRTYNRALQQQLFEREDTAIERQANQLSKLGINPLSQNMNGLGAGSVVSSPTSPTSSYSGSSAPSSVSAPSASSRGGTALQKNMQVVDSLLPLVQLAGDLTSSIEGVSTGKYERDALQLENDRKYLENYVYAYKHGINYDTFKKRKGIPSLNDEKTGKSFYQHLQDNNAVGSDIWSDMDNIKDIQHKINSGIFSSDTEMMKTLKDFSTENYADMAEKVVTNLSSIFNKLNIFGK